MLSIEWSMLVFLLARRMTRTLRCDFDNREFETGAHRTLMVLELRYMVSGPGSPACKVYDIQCQKSLMMFYS